MDPQRTGHNLEQEIKADSARLESVQHAGVDVLEVFFKDEKHLATITYQESGARSTRGIPEAHELLWISHCNRETRFAADGNCIH